MTHSLFGAAVSETIWRALPETQREKAPRFRFWILFASFVANNFPDLDYFYAKIFHSQFRLAYLLHHRGHTHTFVMALLEAALIWSGFWYFGKLRKLGWGRAELATLALAIAAGLCGHIFLDGLNSYGVHPFWPFYNGWLYGDALFIIEPWIWITFSSLLFFSERNQILRALYVLIAFAAIGLCWFSGFVPPEIAVTISFAWILILLLAAYIRERQRLGLLWSLFCVILLTFMLAGQTVRQNTLQAIREILPGVIVNDLILSPAPGNPLCWSVITVDTLDTQRTYRLRRGIVALNANWVDVAECAKTGFFTSVEWKIDHSPLLVLDGQWEGSVGELKEYYRKYCDVAEFLKFARAPLYWREDGKLIFSDYRFEWRSPRPFSRIVVNEDASACRPTYAPWVPPRADLLRGSP